MNKTQEKTNKPIWVTMDAEKCIGCQMCKMDCAAQHSGQKDLPVCYPQSWNLLADGRLSMDLQELSQACQLCQGCVDTPCVTICPTGAVRVLEARQISFSPRVRHMGHPKGKMIQVSA